MAKDEIYYDDDDDEETVTIDLGPASASPHANPFSELAGSIGARNLMIAIVTMPLVFILVVMVMIGAFGGKNDEPEYAAAEPATAVRSVPVEPLTQPALRVTEAGVAGLEREAISLPVGTTAGAISLDGDRLAVRIDGPEGASVVIYDLGLGAVVQTVPIVAEE